MKLRFLDAFERFLLMVWEKIIGAIMRDRQAKKAEPERCLLYTSPSPRD